MLRFGSSIAFLIIIAVATLMLISLAEVTILTDVYPVMPTDIITYDNKLWVDGFQGLAYIAVFIAASGTLFWITYSQLKYRIRKPPAPRTRLAWILLLALQLGATVILAYVFTPATQDWGKAIAIIFFLLNTLLVYWVSSAVFSPSVVKYAPWGAHRLAVPANKFMKRLRGNSI